MFSDMSYQRHQRKKAELPKDKDSLSNTNDLVLPFSISQLSQSRDSLGTV
jgi:hypothetical protein